MNTHIRQGLFRLSVASLLGISAVGLVHAAESAAVSGEIQEITVTAQKVTENIRNVPISISVLGGAEVADMHIQDIGDLTRAVPNFSFSTSGNAGSSQLEVRGISSSAGASTVAMYIDDVPITARSKGYGYVAQPEPMLFDIQQIEVLRGPQGTLYGASAEGGLIKFRLNPVDLTSFGGSASVQVSSTEHGGINYGETAVVNLPLVDGRVGIRLGATTNYDSGYIDRYSPDTGALVGRGVNDQRSTAARLLLEVKATDDLTIAPALFYQHLAYGSSDTLTLGLGGLATNGRVTDSGSDTMIVPSLTIHDDLGLMDFTSVTTDYTRNSPYTYDGTAFNSAYIGTCMLDKLCGAGAALGGGAPVLDLQGNLAGSKIAALPAPAYDELYSRQFSQELRLSSKPYDGSGVPVVWTAGLYYGDTKTRFDDTETVENFNNVFTSLYGAATLNAIFGGPLPNNVIFCCTQRFSEKEYSAFGDLSYYVTPALRLSAGMRYLSARQTLDLTGYGFFYPLPPASSADSKDHASTPRVSATYEVSSKVSVYATASKGFRLGGPNETVPVSLCGPDLTNLGLAAAPASYAHDQLWNYEVGVKAQPSGQFAINGSVFYIKWSQLQQEFVLPTCGFYFAMNVGSARSYGTEIDLTYKPVPEVTARFAGGYTNAVLTQGIPGFGVRSGDPVEGVPNYSGSTSIEYKVPVSPGAQGFLSANYSYTGNSHGTLISTDSDYLRPAYGVVGASIGAAFDTWEVALYAKNLLNNQEIIQRPDHATVPVGFTLRPRTIGLSVSGKF